MILLASLSLTHPALLWGLIAALVPVLIHLLLRPRPRRVRFPALTLMRTSLVAGQRANRLRNLLLMLLRAGLLACAALLLTGPTCIATDSDFNADEPIAAAVVLDDSLSMRYQPRFEERSTLLHHAQSGIRDVLASAESWPPGSELALLRSGTPDAGAALTASFSALGQDWRSDPQPPPNARPLGRALHNAARLLHAAAQPTRHVIVFTDGAASAWRDVPPGVLAGIDALTVRVIRVGPEQPTNLGIGDIKPPPRMWSASVPVPLRVALTATGIDSECWLVARRRQQVLRRVGPLRMTADTTREITLVLPPAPPGPHAVTLALEPEDLLPFDQVGFVTWQTGRAPTAWLVTAPDAGPDHDLSALIFRNLLAPEGLPPEQQRIAVELLDRQALADRLAAASAAADRQRPALIVVFPNVELSSLTLQHIRRAMEACTAVLLVPGSSSSDPDWPGLRALVSESLPIAELLSTPSAIQWTTAPGDAAVEDELLEISRCAVRRRVCLGRLRPETRVAARYIDELPAIAIREFGRGRVVLLTTAPDPSWSDLGVRAAGLLTWLHRVVDEAQGAPSAAAQLTAGEQSRHVFGTLPGSGLVAVTPPGKPERQRTWLRLANGVPRQSWPTDAVGLYTIQAAADETRAARYAVNWPTEEFDLRPITRGELVRKLGTDRLTIEKTGAFTNGTERARSYWLTMLANPARLLAYLLLALFVLELVVAGRRREAAVTALPAESTK